MSFSEKELEQYYRKEDATTRSAILAFLRDSRNPQMVVFGGQAINAHLPPWLDKDTKDWDIMTAGDSEDVARDLEHLLDRRYGGDFFLVKPAKHPGTFRVCSKVTGAVVADISFRDRKVEFKRIDGINYVTLDWLESDTERMLADPETEFRRLKDQDTVQRIRVFRKSRKRRVKKPARGQYIDEGRDTFLQGINY